VLIIVFEEVKKTEPREIRIQPTPKVVALVIGLVLLLVFVGIFATTMIISIEVGHAVLLVDPLSGSTSDPILGPTYVVKAPWVTPIDIYIATDSFSDTIASFSSDQLEMEIQVLVRWSINPNNLKKLYQNYPNLNYKATAIESLLAETMRLITKGFTALETIEFRDVVRNDIEQAIRQEINAEPSLANSLMNFEFDLRNIGYPETYTASIEAKLVAEQGKIQAEFDRERILVLANATAQESIIKAEGIAQAAVIEANATREAIELVLQATGDEGNQTRIAELYLWVRTLQAIAPDIDIMIVGSEGTPVLIPAGTTTP
jgi:regulator of protease activity HflC (stomatin/prohibitin superfamily)